MFENADWASPFGYYYKNINNFKRKENEMSEEMFSPQEEEIIATIEDIEGEAFRQLKLWGTDFDDKNTANDWVAYIVNYVASGAYAGRQEKYDPVKFQEHLKKAAALCVSAIVTIARNGDCAPRHYEKLPNSGATSSD